ncbi:MAG: hypothetical protein GC146_13345 [Limimaricola sp.]|uniref:hypothetical protein n=1 Tax=Limimaricola sp. TaxID=2211665 RepID=UPI001D2097BF|nr:hypothetical protein [Limimaricola sp.]MBI1418199.1 hypothetical protein [Limimaricola sp.]
MARQFDLDQFYSLFQAFDHTGRRMFGAAWRGVEAFAHRTDDPKATRDERDALMDQVRALSGQAALHWTFLHNDMAPDVQQAASEALAPIDRQLAEVRDRLKGIPDVTDSWVKDHAAYTRRRRVEDELKAAFARADLALMVAPHRVVEWRAWSAFPDFRIYFGLSMVRVPSAVSSNRRGPAFIEKAALDSWLERFEWAGSGQGQLTVQERLRIWLEGKFRSIGSEEHAKQWFMNEASRVFPGLTVRTFNAVWAQVAPAAFRAPGRRSKKS